MNTLEWVFGIYTLVFLEASIKSTRAWRRQPPPRDFHTTLWMGVYYVFLAISSILLVILVSQPSIIRPLPIEMTWVFRSLIALGALAYLVRLGRWTIVRIRPHMRSI